MRPIRIAMTFLISALVLAPSIARAETEREREHRAAEDKLWVELGSVKVDFKTERNEIEVGRKEGRFTHLRFKVESADLVMDKIKVTYGDGKVWESDARHEFKEGARSHEISLPEGAHMIRKVEFVARSEKRREPATIVLLGKEAK